MSEPKESQKNKMENIQTAIKAERKERNIKKDETKGIKMRMKR